MENVEYATGRYVRNCTDGFSLEKEIVAKKAFRDGAEYALNEVIRIMQSGEHIPDGIIPTIRKML